MTGTFERSIPRFTRRNGTGCSTKHSTVGRLRSRGSLVWTPRRILHCDSGGSSALADRLRLLDFARRSSSLIRSRGARGGTAAPGEPSAFMTNTWVVLFRDRLNVSLERDRPAVRRPVGTVRQATLIGTVCVQDIDLDVAVTVALEDDLPAVGRPGWRRRHPGGARDPRRVARGRGAEVCGHFTSGYSAARSAGALSGRSRAVRAQLVRVRVDEVARDVQAVGERRRVDPLSRHIRIGHSP
jgi:hypothetical protein